LWLRSVSVVRVSYLVCHVVTHSTAVVEIKLLRVRVE
jgi:hypothetical protein